MVSCYNLILQKLLYMFWVTKVHLQDVNCRTQALWHNVMSKYTWHYGESSMYINFLKPPGHV